MSALVSLRSSFKEQLLESGVKFSNNMPIIIKVVSMALRSYPNLNAHIDPGCTAITYKADHNIGVAMDTPEGLVVPNVKQVQVKSVRAGHVSTCMCMYRCMYWHINMHVFVYIRVKSKSLRGTNEIG